MYFRRTLDLKKRLEKKSHFLIGPRATGKSFLIRTLFPNAKVYDLLEENVYIKLLKNHGVIEQELVKEDKLIVIDEIQRIPSLLNEVHRLIEKKKIKFLLTGSSARKLRHGGANLLAGRAWMAQLFPLTYSEIPNFDILKYLNRGGLPEIYLSENFKLELQNYVSLYLREEIKEEALTRRIDDFARFLDVMGLQNGEELSYEGISSDCGVKSKTVQNYVQILEDTLIGFQVPAYRRTKTRKAITRAKFFLFDIGVVNTLAHRNNIALKSELFGKAFEHFLFLELRAYLSYFNLTASLAHWRSTSGFEVDCVISDQLALEFKATHEVSSKHLKNLKALKEEGLFKKYMIISMDEEKRIIEGIHIYPWKTFLEELNAGRLLSF